MVEFVKFCPQQFFVGKLCFIFSDHGRGEGAAEGVFDDFAVLGGAEEQADDRVFVRLAVVAVEGFEVEVQLAEVAGFESGGLEFYGDEAIQAAMEEEEIDRKILSADLDGIFRADEAKIAAEFSDEPLEAEQETPM